VIDLRHRVYITTADQVRRLCDGDTVGGHILRRIVEIRVAVHTHPPQRRLRLNCGHEVDVPRGLRPTVGKLTACPDCK